MPTLRQTVGRKLAKATLRHSARGFAAKARRRPLHSTSLLGTGVLIGAAAGWLAGRRRG